MISPSDNKAGQIDRLQREHFNAMSGQERVAIAAARFYEVRGMMALRVQRQASEQGLARVEGVELKRRVAAQLYLTDPRIQLLLRKLSANEPA